MGLAGCLGLDSNDSDDDGHSHSDDGHSHDDGGHSHGSEKNETGAEQSFEPPKAVYRPGHMDGMTSIGMSGASGITFGAMHAAPHAFLNVQSSAVREVEIGASDAHLMVKPWGMETGVVPSTASLSATIKKDGAFLGDANMWPMLSQPMGVHFGENVSLDGAGSYSIELTLSPPTSELTGKLTDVFGERVEHTIEFEIAEGDLQYSEMSVDNAGAEGALDPSKMGKKGQLPAGEELPGSFVGEAISDDAVFAVTTLTDVSRFGAEGQTYLAVSPRTPYNRYPLPNMTMSATIEREGETVLDDSLTETLDHELDLHHGAVLEELQSGDTITLRVDGGRANVSRHLGYDTAFLDIGEVELAVE